MSFENLLDNLSEKVKEQSTHNDSDYIGEDGLLYCGNCHTAKQVQIDFCGSKKIVYCACKCQYQKYLDEKNKIEKEQYMREIAEMRKDAFPTCRNGCNPSKDMKSWTFQNDKRYHPEISDIARKYVENFDDFKKNGIGFLFYGDTGTGKSYISACIANALIDRHYPVLMTDFSTISDIVQGTFQKQEYFMHLNEYSLLILDDLAAERDTSYMQEIVYKIINNRVNIGLPMIITSNLTGEQLKNPENTGEKRILSRALSVCTPIQVQGEDLRQKQGAFQYAEIMRKLGIRGGKP